MDKGTVRIGMSGWRYAPWRGVFYPQALPQRDELRYASRVFASIELNGSFYSLQRPESYQAWYEDTPPGFQFAVKGPRFITHMKRLRDVRPALANFLASGVLALREKLGPILWQFPPSFGYRRETFAAFFDLLPFNTATALRLARARESRMKGRAYLRIDETRRLRHAIEVRHESFRDPDFIALLRRYGIALVVSDTPKKWLRLEDVTADFIYLRLHGAQTLYRSGYGKRAIKAWAGRIECWRRGGEPPGAARASGDSATGRARRDVYCYFDNTDVKLRAPQDAQALARELGVGLGRRVPSGGTGGLSDPRLSLTGDPPRTGRRLTGAHAAVTARASCRATSASANCQRATRRKLPISTCGLAPGIAAMMRTAVIIPAAPAIHPTSRAAPPSRTSAPTHATAEAEKASIAKGIRMPISVPQKPICTWIACCTETSRAA